MHGANVSKQPSAIDGLIGKWRKVLDGFFKAKTEDKVINEIAKRQVEAEMQVEGATLPTIPPSQRVTITRSYAFQRQLDAVGSATEEIRNQAASAGVDLNELSKRMGSELDKRRTEYNGYSNTYRKKPQRTIYNRQTELFYRIWVECTHIFREFLDQIFQPPPPPDDDQSSYKDFRKPVAVQVVWRKKSVKFQVPVPKPASTGKKYTCNGYHHKPGCTCGWGPRAGSGKPGTTTKTVTKKIWVPAIYIVPAGTKPPVVA